MRPPLIGLTGTVGAGKSTALEVLAELGAATISSDAVVHELLDTDELRELLVARWGDRVAPAGRLDRSLVAALVFEDADELSWLEAQLHPRVGERIATWLPSVSEDAPLAAVEVPLLFEAGMEEMFDAILCVTAPAKLRAERVAARGLDDLAARDARQLPPEEKVARSDFVVENEGTPADLQAKLEALLPELAKARKL